MTDLLAGQSRLGNTQVTTPTGKPLISPAPQQPKPTAPPAPSQQPTEPPTQSDKSGVAREYNSFDFKKEVKFTSADDTTVRTSIEGKINSSLEYLIGRSESNSNLTNAQKREASHTIIQELSKIGSLSALHSDLLNKIKSITGIESDAELEIIAEIINDPNYQKYFSDKFSAFELSKILKGFTNSDSKERFLETFMSFLKDIPNNPERNVENIKTLVKATATANKVVFNDNLHSIEDRANPFLTEQEITDKKADGNKPVTLAQLKENGKLDISRYEGLAFLLGIGKKTEANYELLAQVKIPQWLADMIINSSTEDLPKLLEQYREFISIPGKKEVKKEEKQTDKKQENQSTNQDDKTEDVNTDKKEEVVNSKPNEVSVKGQEIIDKIKSSGANKQNINELIDFLKNNKFSDLSSSLLKEIESTIGIKDMTELNLLDKVLNNSSYSSSFESSLSIPNLTKILSNLKGSDTKLFLNTMMSFVNSSRESPNLKGLTELIKTTCKDKNIVFNNELHNKADRCNPLLSSQEVASKKNQENEMVSLTDVEKTLKVTVVKRDQFLFGLIKGKGQKTEKTENENLKIEIPRWLSDLMSSAQSVEQLKKIIEENKAFIKTTSTKTGSEEKK